MRKKNKGIKAFALLIAFKKIRERIFGRKSAKEVLSENILLRRRRSILKLSLLSRKFAKEFSEESPRKNIRKIIHKRIFERKYPREKIEGY